MKKGYLSVLVRVVETAEVVRASRIIFALGDSAGEDVFTE